eukprot:RCo041635
MSRPDKDLKKKKPGKDEELPPEEPSEGTGVFIYEDGSRYEGGWVKDGVPLVIKRKGFGVYIDGNNRYEGQWENDKMKGEGSFYFDSGAVYKGWWTDNQFEGKGTYTWPDSSCYEGSWRSNRMHGEGVYRDVNGKRWHGKFYNGTGPGLNQEIL